MNIINFQELIWIANITQKFKIKIIYKEFYLVKNILYTLKIWVC